MNIIYVLVTAHFIADWLCQTDWMALNKSKRWDALLLHVTVYTAVLAVIVGVFQPPSTYPYVTLKQFALFIWVNFMMHFLTDAVTSRVTSRLWFLKMYPHMEWTTNVQLRDGAGNLAYYIKDTGTRHWFFVVIGLDQLLHYIVLFKTAEWWLQ